MNKTKRILISLCLALVFMIVFNLAYSHFYKDEKSTVFVVKETITSGEKITMDKVRQIDILDKELTDNSVQIIEEDLYAAIKLNPRANIKQCSNS